MYEHLRMADGTEDTIEGWLIPFDGPFNNGKDSYGTVFSARTDYCLDWFTERPWLYGHGLDPDVGRVPAGRMFSLEIRETGGPTDHGGVWMKARLDEQGKYFDEIRQLVKDKKLYLSSASLSHLVEVNQRTGHVDVWPLIEGSGTTTPSNLYAEIPVSSFRAAYRSAGIELDDTAIAHLGSDEGTLVTSPKRDMPMMDPEDAAETPTGNDAEVERSFEDIRGDIERLLNPMYAAAWTQILNTWATKVRVKRCDYSGGEYGPWADDDECVTYWDIPYTLGADLEPVLGTPVLLKYEEVFTPVAAGRAADMPLSVEATHFTRHAAAFTASTKDYGERRFREGRMLSTGNMQTISDVADGLESHAKSLRDLHERAMARQEEAARAAYFANPIAQQWEIDLLDLGIT